MGIVTGGAGHTVIIKRQFYADLFHGSLNNCEHFLGWFYQVITAHRVTSLEPYVTARTVLVDGFIVKTNVLDSRDLSVREEGVAERTGLLLYETLRVQLGMSVHLTIIL